MKTLNPLWCASLFIIFILIASCEKFGINECEQNDSEEIQPKEIQWTSYTILDGLVSNDVMAIAIDKEGNKWFGTQRGVSKFDGNTWTNYTTSDGLVGDRVRSIAIDNEGNKWFGTIEKGASRFNGTTWTNYTTSDGLVSNDVMAIAIDKEGNKWFATHMGVSKFDGNTWTNYRSSDRLPRDHYYSITSIAIDAQDVKWFGTTDGVLKFDGNTWTHYTTFNGISSNYVSAIAIDKKGNKWFGIRFTGDLNGPILNGGISKVTGTGWTNYNIPCSGNSVTTIVTDEQDNIWIASDWIEYIPYPGSDFGYIDESLGCGVSKFDGNKWTAHYGISFFPAFGFVDVIAIDKEGNKWFGTAFGVKKLSD